MIELRVGSVRIRAHALMLLFPMAAAMLGQGVEATALMIGLAAHETGHLLAARALSVRVESLRLMPFGGAIDIGNPYALTPARLMGVAAAGPAANLSLLILAAALSHWRWLDPLSALRAAQINGLLLLFNLLPALPLDGGRILCAMLSRRLGRTRAVMPGIAMGAATGGALLLWGVWSGIDGGRLNLSLILCGIFILASLPEERRALTQAPAQAMLAALRPLNGPKPVNLWAIPADCPLPTALRTASFGSMSLYAVFERDKLRHLLDENALLNAAIAGKAIVSDALPVNRTQ